MKVINYFGTSCLAIGVEHLSHEILIKRFSKRDVMTQAEGLNLSHELKYLAYVISEFSLKDQKVPSDTAYLSVCLSVYRSFHSSDI